MRAIAIVLAVLALALPARAEPAHRSPGVALGLSLGATAGGLGILLLNPKPPADPLIALGAAGVALGPTVGHWYAGEIVTPGLGLRVIGTGIGIYGMNRAASELFGDSPRQGSTSGILLLAGGLFVGGAIYDIATAPAAADDWNARHAANVALTPTALRTTRGDLAPGLALVGSF